MIVTSPIVTGTLNEATGEPWVLIASIAGIVVGVLLGGTTAGFLHEKLAEHGQKLILAALYGLAGVLAFFGMLFVVASLTLYDGQDDREFHPTAVGEAVSDRYTIETIHGLDDLEDSVWIDETINSVCHTVSTESPELTGIADGQQISFKVGIRDCHAKNPVADIIITKTPGPAISADDLLKK